MIEILSRPFLVIMAFLFLVAPSARAEESLMVKDPVKSGEARFNKFCAGCHGEGAAGTDKGPTLIHKFYHPNHHSDWSFRRAVAQGVTAHHWRFGDMPRVEGLSPEEVEDIIMYVRRIQKDAGVF